MKPQYKVGVCRDGRRRNYRRCYTDDELRRLIRFNSEIIHRGHKTACWKWAKRKTSEGYPKLESRGKHCLAHRLAWTLYRGEIPTGLFVCHDCDFPDCVNPNHLFLGTPKSNNQDSHRKGRRRKDASRMSILTEAQVLEIHRDRQACSLSKLAMRYGVTKGTISAVVKGRTWKHLMPKI